MHRLISWAAILLLCCAGMVRADVTIAAAISLKGALEKAQPELENAAGEKVTFTFGASGTLAGQIRQGAPVDLYISADRANPQKLAEGKLAESMTVVAGNEMVLVCAAQSTGKPPASFADLTRLGKVAIGDPKIVPAGAYAKEVLAHEQVYDGLEKGGKLVTAENVAQVLSLVRRDEVDAGIVYASDAKGVEGVRIVAAATPAMHGAIEYVSVVVSASARKGAAEKVQRAMLGEKVQAAFKEAGFLPPPAPATTQK